LIVVIAVIPGAFLQRWFDPDRAAIRGQPTQEPSS
jgi:hypothetical protein